MAQRAGEFAIRLALGGSRANITRIVLTTGVKLALLSSALGLLGAYGAIRIGHWRGCQTNGSNRGRPGRHHAPAHHRRAGRVLDSPPARPQDRRDDGLARRIIRLRRAARD